MRVKPKQKIQALQGSDRQVEVARIDGNLITFKMFFEVDPMEIIDSKINICEFKVYEERKVSKSKVKTKTLTSVSALQTATLRKLTARDATNQVIARGLIDLTKSIPNDRIAAIAAGEPVRRNKKVVFTDDKNEGAVGLVSSEAIERTPNDVADLKSSFKDVFNRKSRDPAADLNAADFHSPVVNATRGVRITSDVSKINSKQRAVRSALSSSSTNGKSSKLEQEELSTLQIDFPIKLRKQQAREYTVEIIARAPVRAGQTGRALQSIKIKANFQRAYENHIIPTKPPALQFTSIGTLRFMNIKQMDRNGASVVVFRKNTQAPVDPGGLKYNQLLNIPLKFGQEIQISDKPGQLGKSIYRVVPYNELSYTSGLFSSAVAPGSRISNRGSEADEATILAYETNGGVQVSVFNMPNEVVSVRLIRKNLTTNETEFSTPGTVVGGPIRSFSKLRADIKIFDRPARVDAVYEYKVVLINSYGEERQSIRSCIIYFSGNFQDQQGYTFSTSSPITSNNSVKFSVDALTNQASLDLVYKLLTAQGLDTQYASEITNNKQLLSKLVALEMLRFDTVTGLNESFGVVSAGTFQDDSTTRKAAGVSTLVQGRRYIYQFRLLLRSPSTIFNDSSINKLDLETGKSYSTDQKKFNSPNAIKRGTLASTSTQTQTVTKDGQKFDASSSSAAEMLAGRTALTGQFEVTVPFSETTLTNLTVESTARGNVVSWNVNEGLQKIDHIIVYADYNGKLAPINALHFCGTNKMVYLDDKLKATPDEVGYYVQLVFHDYSQSRRVGPGVEVINAS